MGKKKIDWNDVADDYLRGVPFVVTGVFSSLLAAAITLGAVENCGGPDVHAAKQYHQETRPSVMCVEMNEKYQILVEDQNDHYIRLEDYLQRFHGEQYDRKIEEVTIRKTVGWNPDKEKCER